jgi:hypothetical protein
VVLAAARVLVQEALKDGVVAIRLDQLDLRVGQVDEADADPPFGKGALFGDVGDAEDVTVEFARLSMEGVTTPIWLRLPITE